MQAHTYQDLYGDLGTVSPSQRARLGTSEEVDASQGEQATVNAIVLLCNHLHCSEPQTSHIWQPPLTLLEEGGQLIG